MKVASGQVIDALQVTVAAIGCEMKPETVAVLAHELAEYPEPMVLGALARCKLECKYRLSLADIIERIDDGWPGPDEAWDLVPKSEDETAVITQEIMCCVPFNLIVYGDFTAARMAFREAYTRARAQARAEGRMPKWFASLGHDKQGREAPLLKAVQLGRLTSPQVSNLLPGPMEQSKVTVLADHLITSFPKKTRKLAL